MNIAQLLILANKKSLNPKDSISLLKYTLKCNTSDIFAWPEKYVSYKNTENFKIKSLHNL